MKRKSRVITSCIVAIACLILLAGCGEKMPYGDLKLSDYIKVGEYKGLKAEAYTVKVERSEIADKINSDLESAAVDKKLKKGEEIKSGDTVVIDYVGRKDGKKFEGGSAKDYSLEIGSNSFIDGFEDGLIGKKVGDKDIKLNLTFPEDYASDELKGQDVVFTVSIDSATRSTKPEYNDKFVKGLGDYKNTDEYEKAVEKSLYKQKEENAKSEQKQGLFDQAVTNAKMKKYPETELNKYVDTFDKQVDTYASQYGTDRATMLEQFYGVSSDKDAKAFFEDQAKRLVKQEMFIEYVAEKENLSYSKEEAEKFTQNITAQGYDEAMIESQTGRTMEQYVHIALLLDKVQDFILENAKIK